MCAVVDPDVHHTRLLPPSTFGLEHPGVGAELGSSVIGVETGVGGLGTEGVAPPCFRTMFSPMNNALLLGDTTALGDPLLVVAEMPAAVLLTKLAQSPRFRELEIVPLKAGMLSAQFCVNAGTVEAGTYSLPLKISVCPVVGGVAETNSSPLNPYYRTKPWNAGRAS